MEIFKLFKFAAAGIEFYKINLESHLSGGDEHERKQTKVTFYFN